MYVAWRSRWGYYLDSKYARKYFFSKLTGHIYINK
jgi:hypothetical protein